MVRHFTTMKKLTKLTEFLTHYNPRTPVEALQMVALVKISQVAGFNRVEGKSPDFINSIDGINCANVYGITFMDSGAGKDLPYRQIDENLLCDIHRDYYDRLEQSYNDKIKSVIEQAEILYPGKNTEKSKFISANSPYSVDMEIPEATLEGFASWRETFAQYGWGGTYVKISEFADYILSEDQRRDALLVFVQEVFDTGSSRGKALKGNKGTTATFNVPSTASFHTSPTGLLEGKGKERLLSFLNRGIARRSFVCYPQKLKDVLTDEEAYQIRIQGVRKAKEIRAEVEGYFNKMYEATKKDPQITHNTNATYTFTKEAEDYIMRYEVSCKNRAEQIPDDTDEVGIRSELASRAWKVWKLSVLLACFEHPEVKTVELEDVKQAVTIADTYASHLTRFYRAKPTDKTTKLYNYLVERRGQWVTRMEIREHGFIRGPDFNKWFDGSIEHVIDILESQGYTFEEAKYGTRGKKYKVDRLTKDNTEEKKVQVSGAKTNKVEDTTFNPGSLPFEKMHKVTGRNGTWSATTYKENKRSDKNATGQIDMVVLDVDSGLAMSDCIKMLEGKSIKALVATTKSHMKEKGGITCDRYRVLLPLSDSVVMTPDEYKKKVSIVSQVLDIPNDRSTVNISRLWFGNPEQEYTYIQGNCIDINAFKEVEKPKYKHIDIPDYIASSGGNYQLIVKWFAQNVDTCGGRDPALYRFAMIMKDDGLEKGVIRENLYRLNNVFPQGPYDLKMIESKIMKQL